MAVHKYTGYSPSFNINIFLAWLQSKPMSKNTIRQAKNEFHTRKSSHIACLAYELT